MSHRYVIGNLAEDPESRQAGRVQIVTFTVLENTSTYHGNERVPGHKPLRHLVEARFELGSNVLASLHTGHPVIVIGNERDGSFDGNDGTVYRRIIDATHVGPDLARSTAVVTRNQPKADAATAPRFEPAAVDEPAPVDEPAASATGSLWGQS